MPKSYIVSKQIDKVLFFVSLLIILITSYSITVYHHIYVADVELIRINKDGDSFNEPVSNIIKLFGYGGYKKDIFWRNLEDAINNNTEIKYQNKNYEPGTKLVWTVHYSYNSTKKNKIKKYIYEAGVDGKLQKKNL